MTQMAGADPEALLALGETFRRKATLVSEIRDSTSEIVNSLAWTGADADGFLALWSVSYGPKFDSAAAFLIDAAEALTRNAAEQTAASAGGPAGFADEGANLNEHLTERFTSPNFALSAYEEALRSQMGDIEFDDWLRNNGKLFKFLDDFARGVNLMSNFLEDAVQHPDLPTDERIVHAIGEVALKYAAEKGISEAMQWAGAAIAAVFTAGAGVLVGRAVGWLAGQVATAGFHYLDEKYQVTDQGADLILEGYRNVRDNPDQYLRAVPGIGPAVLAGAEAWDAATDLAPLIAEFGESVSDAASASRETVSHAIDDLMDATIQFTSSGDVASISVEDGPSMTAENVSSAPADGSEFATVEDRSNGR